MMSFQIHVSRCSLHTIDERYYKHIDIQQWLTKLMTTFKHASVTKLKDKPYGAWHI